VLLLLVDAGADARLLTDDGKSALDIAVSHDRQEAVSFLLDHDISLVRSVRALTQAARKGRPDLCRMLLDMGADVNAEVCSSSPRG
jgi:ankyrin repeat protein